MDVCWQGLIVLPIFFFQTGGREFAKYPSFWISGSEGAEIFISSLDTAVLTGKADKPVSLDWLRPVTRNNCVRNNYFFFYFRSFKPSDGSFEKEPYHGTSSTNSFSPLAYSSTSWEEESCTSQTYGVSQPKITRESRAQTRQLLIIVMWVLFYRTQLKCFF